PSLVDHAGRGQSLQPGRVHEGRDIVEGDEVADERVELPAGIAAERRLVLGPADPSAGVDEEGQEGVREAVRLGPRKKSVRRWHARISRRSAATSGLGSGEGRDRLLLRPSNSLATTWKSEPGETATSWPSITIRSSRFVLRRGIPDSRR